MIDWPYVIVSLLGVAIGSSELLARYSDAPWATLKQKPSLFYLALNAFAAFLALFLMRTFGWADCGDDPCTLAKTTQHVLAAGLGGMAVLRASVMTLKVQGEDVGVGPAALIQIYLNVADRATDRSRAQKRADSIATLMGPISFAKALTALPAACFSLMQNVSAEEQTVVSNQVKGRENADIPHSIKSILLGLSLLDIVGHSALESAIKLLGEEIKKAEGDA
jgi:hypothetical protein